MRARQYPLTSSKKQRETKVFLERLCRGRIENQEHDDVAAEQARSVTQARFYNPDIATELDDWRMLVALRRAEFLYGRPITVPITVDDLGAVKRIAYRQLAEDVRLRGIRDDREYDMAFDYRHLVDQQRMTLRRQAESAERDGQLGRLNRLRDFLSEKRKEYRRGG